MSDVIVSIDESFVESGTTHRRAGLHTDRHPAVLRGGVGIPTQWGGNIQGRGGIFLASNVANSCALWDCEIDEPGPHGDCEHLRDEILARCEAPVILQPNHLYWMSDNVPHESLPLRERTFRQFFRVVTSRVSHWFKKHSTANPLGIVPPPNCEIVLFDKFEQWSPQIHENFGSYCNSLLSTLTCGLYRLMDTQVLQETDPALIEATLECLRRCDILEGDGPTEPVEPKQSKRAIRTGFYSMLAS